MFLDEPTSGLDSYSAYNCVKLLSTVAKTNTTILCTIHQPSSEIFFLFDLIIVMNNGKVLYQGPVTEMAPHFKIGGFACPENYNPSDYVMFLNQTETEATLTERGVFMNLPPANLFSNSAMNSVVTVSGEKSITIKSSLLKQTMFVAYRECVNSYRDVTALVSRFGLTIFLSVLYGLIFMGIGGKDNSDPTNLNSHFGSMTMVSVCQWLVVFVLCLSLGGCR